MGGPPKNDEGAGPPESLAPLRSVLTGLAEESAAIRALGTRSGGSAVTALDGFATGDALRTALARWQRRTDTLEQALGEASTALGDGRPDPAA